MKGKKVIKKVIKRMAIIVFAIIIFGIYGPGYNASDFIYAQF